MANMFEISMAVLNCAEYNPEKIKAYWGEPKSPAEALCQKLEFGIWISVQILLCSEKYHRNKSDDKQASMKLRKKLAKLLDKPVQKRTENERVDELIQGLKKATSYLEKIKIKGFMRAKTLQQVEKKLKKLLEANTEI
jgi:hypothetical protein